MYTIVKGIVDSNQDSSRSGMIMATFETISKYSKDVYLTSPAFRSGGGGLLFVPEKGDIILALYDEESDELYYNSTVISHPINVDSEGNPHKLKPYFKPIPGRNTYNLYGKPVQVKYENQEGNGLCITSESTSYEKFNENTESRPPPRIIDSVTLKSSYNKMLKLDDSPQSDAIFLTNQHKDGLIITGDATESIPMPAQSIQAKSCGPHFYTCMKSYIDMRVVEGQDITIENNSTGAGGQSPSRDSWPNGETFENREMQPPKKWGGIYLRSENGDVALVSQATDGRIFISTPNSQIQIVKRAGEDVSDIVLYTNGRISVESDEDIDIFSGGNVNIEATADINLKAGGEFKARANVGKLSIKSSGNVGIDGAEIHLNSGESDDAASSEGLSPILSDYGD